MNYLCNAAFWCLVWQAGIWSSLAQSRPGSKPTETRWNFTAPIRICTSSVEDFGSRCNGSPVPAWESQDVPQSGWCSKGVNFCGYDLDIWRTVADKLGLKENVHYERVCMGENGFGPMIEDLARLPFDAMDSSDANQTHPGGRYFCDMGTSSITANVERAAMGIIFSRATHRSHLAVMVLAPLKSGGRWAFFLPMATPVWLSLGATILIVPFFVFFFEAVFSAKCIYRDRSGKLNVLWGIKEAMWHSVSHTLSIDVFRVTSLPARIVTAAYAFLVLILTNTYTANLAAFLTVSHLDLGIGGIEELRGKPVGTIPTYTNRLYHNHRIIASATDGWDHDLMEAKLVDGTYRAIISDSQQLIPRANKDQTCSLNLLPGIIEPFDLAFAYRKGFPYSELMSAVDDVLIQLQENGAMSDLQDQNNLPEPSCRGETEYAETNQVGLGSLTGLWLLLAACLGLALLAAVYEYFWWLRGSPDKRAVMRARAATLVYCGRRGNPDAWARTETLLERAKQDLPPTQPGTPSGFLSGLSGLVGGLTGRIHDNGVRAAAPAAATASVSAAPEPQPIPVDVLTCEQVQVSPRGLQAIIDCASANTGGGGAGNTGSGVATFGAGGKDAAGEVTFRGPPRLFRLGSSSSDGGTRVFCPTTSEYGSGRSSVAVGAVGGPQLLQMVSSCGGGPDAAAAGPSFRRGSTAGPPSMRSSISMDRNELPDPTHVLGTVENAADAFRMSNQMRNCVLLDDIESDPADPVAPTAWLRAGADAAAASGGAGPGGSGVSSADAPGAVGASPQEGERGVGARTGAADVEPQGETSEGGGVASMHGAAARAEVDRLRHDWKACDVHPSPPVAVSPDVHSCSLPGPLPKTDIAAVPLVASELQHAVLRPRSMPPLSPSPSPPPLPEAATAGTEADDPEVAAAARQGALVAAVMQSGVPAAGDTGEELRRLRQIVARLGSHLDSMLATCASERS